MATPYVSIGETTIFQYLLNEAVLLNMSTQEYFALDEIGTEMWRLLMDTGDVEQIIGQLRDIYEVDEPTLRRDVESLVARLLDAGLLATQTGSE